MNYNPIDKYPSNAKIILLVVLITISFNLFAVIILFLSNIFELNLDERFIQSISQIIFLFGLTIIISRTIPIGFKELFRLEENISLKYFIIGIIGLFFINLFNTGYIEVQEYLIPDSLLPKYNLIYEYMEELYKKMLLGSDVFDFLIAILIGAIIPAISEEFLFRGFGQRALEENNSVLYSVLVISIIFGFIHLNIINLVPLIIIGIFLGYLAYYSKSIIVPIFIHFINNAFSILFMYLEKTEVVNPFDKIGITSSLLFTFCGIVGVIVSIIILSRLGNSKT